MQGNAEFMREAIRLASENVTSGRGGPFGCVVVKDGKVIATGSNQVTAIRNACEALGTFQLTDCDVYTSCEPCPMCLAALYWSRCRAIYYGNDAADAARVGFDDSFLYDEVRKPLSERTIPIVNLLGEEAWESFAEWEKSPFRVEY